MQQAILKSIPAAISAALVVSTLATPTYSLDVIEPGATVYERKCFVVGRTNTEAKWRVELRRFVTEELIVALEGEGFGGALMSVVEGQANYVVTRALKLVPTVTLNGNPVEARVQSVGGTISNAQGEPSLIMTVIGGEDSSDNDWQDMVLSITCIISES